jgi:hypothetical protein
MLRSPKIKSIRRRKLKRTTTYPRGKIHSNKPFNRRVRMDYPSKTFNR